MLVLRSAVAIALDLPDFLPIDGIQADDFRFAGLGVAVAVDQLQIEPAAIQQGRGGEAELDIELAVLRGDVQFPDLFPADGVATERAVGEKGPDVLAIGAGRRGSKIPFVVAATISLPKRESTIV